MRELAFLLLLMGTPQQAVCSKLVTVEQLEQTLAATRDMKDADVAKQLSELELTERLSRIRLARLEPELPGRSARKALTLLADASAFLNLPLADLPSNPTPDRAAQVSMLALVREYVVKTILKLPNFFATRETTNYVNTPVIVRIKNKNTIEFEPLHEVDNSRVTVLYRDGREFMTKGARFGASTKDLRTAGEFGPILITVWNDASKGEVIWSHWEQGVGGAQAVFHYAVPQQASHYLVTFPGLQPETQHHPAYHGEIAVNPIDGSILRLTVVAELDPNDAMTSASLMVKYGPVEVGGRTYVCPVQSVALSQVRVVNQVFDGNQNVEHKYLGVPRTYMNKVLFTHYHLFRAQMRILPQGGDQNPSAIVPATPSIPVPEI